MKLRTALGGVVGAVGATVATNRLLAKRAIDLENPLPGIEQTYHWRGMDVVYTEAGDPNDPDMLLLHGINAAASSYEFERVFEDLAEDYHVVAVDLPGFGRSDRPPLVYSAAIYEEFVRDFASDVTDEPVVVASSLTGSYAVAAAEDADVERLVLICPTDETTDERPWVRTVLRTPVIGTTLFNVLASKPSIRYFLDRDGYYDPDRIDQDEVDYAWHSAHQPGARFAPASFTSGTLDPDFDLQTELAALDVPTTLVWGRDAELVSLREGRDLAEAADLDLVVVDYATLLPHSEHPEQFVEYLRAELPRIGNE